MLATAERRLTPQYTPLERRLKILFEPDFRARIQQQKEKRVKETKRNEAIKSIVDEHMVLSHIAEIGYLVRESSEGIYRHVQREINGITIEATRTNNHVYTLMASNPQDGMTIGMLLTELPNTDAVFAYTAFHTERGFNGWHTGIQPKSFNDRVAGIWPTITV